jgi:pimeloyl-ACP methyl ester carboxylesterase
LAVLAAGSVGASAVVAICPADPAGLRRGLRSGALTFDADVGALDPLLARFDLYEAVSELSVPMLLMHAAGDEQVPVEFSRELAQHFRVGESRLIVVPGGHHRSVQHDPELQAVSVKFLVRALSGRAHRLHTHP